MKLLAEPLPAKVHVKVDSKYHQHCQDCRRNSIADVHPWRLVDWYCFAKSRVGMLEGYGYETISIRDEEGLDHRIGQHSDLEEN